MAGIWSVVVEGRNVAAVVGGCGCLAAAMAVAKDGCPGNDVAGGAVRAVAVGVAAAAAGYGEKPETEENESDKT